MRASVDDRLLHDLPEQLSVVASRRPGLILGHQDDNHLLLRIDPEPGPRGPTPRVLAGRAGYRVESRFFPDRESEPERVAARDGARDLDVTEMIRRHVAHGGTAQQPDAIEMAAVEQHLAKARVVPRRPGGAGAPRVILLRRRDVEQLDRLARRLVRRERLRQTANLVLRYEECRVGHLERGEDALREELAEGGSRDRLDPAAQHVGRKAVLPGA